MLLLLLVLRIRVVGGARGDVVCYVIYIVFNVCVMLFSLLLL